MPAMNRFANRRTRLQLELGCELQASFATQSVADPLQRLSVTIRLATMGHREVREPLREDLTTTVAGAAVAATRSQCNAAANALPGKIAEGSAILTVDMTRADAAKWA